jgi:hypothetical protein
MAERTISNSCSMVFGDFLLFGGGSGVSFIDTFSLFFFVSDWRHERLEV